MTNYSAKQSFEKDKIIFALFYISFGLPVSDWILRYYTYRRIKGMMWKPDPGKRAIKNTLCPVSLQRFIQESVSMLILTWRSQEPVISGGGCEALQKKTSLKKLRDCWSSKYLVRLVYGRCCRPDLTSKIKLRTSELRNDAFLTSVNTHTRRCEWTRVKTGPG